MNGAAVPASVIDKFRTAIYNHIEYIGLVHITERNGK